MPTSLPPVSLMPTLPSFLKLMNLGSGLMKGVKCERVEVLWEYSQVGLVLGVETRFLPALPGTEVVLG